MVTKECTRPARARSDNTCYKLKFYICIKVGLSLIMRSCVSACIRKHYGVCYNKDRVEVRRIYNEEKINLHKKATKLQIKLGFGNISW